MIRRLRKSALILGGLMLVSVPAAADIPSDPFGIYDTEVHRSDSMVVAFSQERIDGYRYASIGLGGPLPPNVDAPLNRGVPCDVEVAWRSECSFSVLWDNPTGERRHIRIELASGAPTSVVTPIGQGESGDPRATVAPGEYVIMGGRLRFDPLLGTSDRITFNVLDEESGDLLDSIDVDYSVEKVQPSAPVGLSVRLTDDGLSVEWDAPINDGGYTITGYRVDLLVPSNPFLDTFEQVQLACNFSGRPELHRCDLPNNQLTTVHPGEYLIRVRAETDAPANARQRDGKWAYTGRFSVDRTLQRAPSTTTTTTGPPTTTTTQPTMTTTSTSTPLPPVTAPPVTQPPRTPEDGSISGARTLEEIVESIDYTAEDARVVRLYQAFFDRRPDVSGTKYWLGVRRRGQDVLQIARHMSAGIEFANAYDGTTDAAFVQRVYTNVLGRDYDEKGYRYWLDQVTNGGLSRPDMVLYVTANAEFINAYPFGYPTG